jgi:hypothetical protein
MNAVVLGRRTATALGLVAIVLCALVEALVANGWILDAQGAGKPSPLASATVPSADAPSPGSFPRLELSVAAGVWWADRSAEGTAPDAAH